jgi:hypothetical protein
MLNFGGNKIIIIHLCQEKNAQGYQNPPSNLGIKTDELVKSQKWDGKVKRAKCKACES